MKPQNTARLKSVISRFDKAKVLVVGDLILDEFIWGKVTRISPEAPVPVVWVNSENFMPGGASNVANNIRALGGEAHLVGVVGDDGRGETLRSLLTRGGVGCDGIFADPGRPTTQKTRIIAHHQQVVRIDREIIRPVSEELLRRMLDYIAGMLPKMDALIIEDYGKGVIAPRLVREIVKLAKTGKKIITVDPKEENFSYYRGVTTITPNHHEAGSAVGFALSDDALLKKAGEKLLSRLNCESVLITLGENGMCLFEKGKAPLKIPTVAQEVYDVSGAGDTVISAYTLARASGAAASDAALISNYAAGIVVGKIGVAVTNRRELIARIQKEAAK